MLNSMYGGANSTNTFNDNGSIVGAFVDGVYKPRASQQTRAFFDVERIEFLKGPQGTLYGRNTFAGALNLHTNKPNFDGLSARSKASYNRFNTSKFEGHVNVTVNDNFAFRLAGFLEDGDGHISNDAGPDAGAPDDQGFRLSALWQPSNNLEILSRVSRVTETGTTAGLFGYKNICRRVTPQGLTDPFGSALDCGNPQRGSGVSVPNGDPRLTNALDIPDPNNAGNRIVGLPRGDTDPYSISQDFVPDADLKEDNFTLEINFDAGPVLGKSITSYTDFENPIGFDFDYSATPHQRGGFDETAESWTQEINFSSDYDSPLQWTSGAYYSRDKTFFNFWIYDQNMRSDAGRAQACADGSTPAVGLCDDRSAPLPVFSGTPVIDARTSLDGFFASSQWIEIDTFGLYGQFDYSVQDNLRLIGGLRYNYENKDLTGGGSNFTTNGPVTVRPGVAGSSPTILPDNHQVFAYNRNAGNAVERSFNNISWKGGLEYDIPGQDAMLYFTSATGFLSGAVNNDGTSTDEQESQVYEAGIKSILMNGQVLFNLAFHYTEYSNLLSQFQVLDPNTGNVLTRSRNGGEIDAWGIELESVYAPAHIEGLKLGLNAAYLNAEFGEFGQTSPYQLHNGQPAGFINVEGETPGWSPEFTVSVTAAYEIDLGQNGLIVPSLQFYYSDDYNTSNLLSIDPNHDQDSYTKTDLRLIWFSPDQQFSVEAYAENLEDEAVLARGNNGSQDNVQTGYLYPRNFGVRFAARF